MAIERTIRVMVAYALPARQCVEEVIVPVGSTAREAIEASTLPGKFSDMDPGIDLGRNRIGIYSRLIDPETVVEDGDRIEIYRALKADPKVVRRQRAKEGRTMARAKRK
jgi:putative ubiquitin-RnfH superfamily antitoxin RatB of RatAB toxin-antitoxin module